MRAFFGFKKILDKFPWSAIIPGNSSEVAAAVTDETGSPGSLVFSGNPTLQGVTVDGLSYIGDPSPPSGVTQLGLMTSTNTSSGLVHISRKSCDTVSGPSIACLKSRGTASSPVVVNSYDNAGFFSGAAFDGSNYVGVGSLQILAGSSIASGSISGILLLNVAKAGAAPTEAFRISENHSVTLGGASTAPALKVTPVASQARWIEVTAATSSGNPAISASGGSLTLSSNVDATAGLDVSGAAFTSRGISDTATATALTLSGSGANSLTIANSATNPTIGTSAGDLQINGSYGKVAQFTSDATPANYVRLQSRNTGAGPIIWAEGSDTNVGLEYRTQNAGSHLFITDDSAGPIQVAITHTASANRYITLTGSNGANPKIATSAGSLDIGSAVVLTGQTVGTTVGAAGGASALPATPLGYLTTSINGTACKIPYYNT